MLNWKRPKQNQDKTNELETEPSVVGPGTDNLPLIFLHMYKAGGTSIRRYLRAQHPEANVVYLEGYIPKLKEWQAQPENARHSVDLLLGHQYFGNHEYLRPGATYLTFLREPVDRVLSFFHYVRRMPDHYLHNHGFNMESTVAQAIERTNCVEFDNLQVRMLNPQPKHKVIPFGQVTEEMLEVACNNLRCIHESGFVGVVEQMDAGLNELRRTFGWDPSKITRANVSENRPGVEWHDKTDIAAIRDLNQLDHVLYALAEELFCSRLSDS